MPYTRNQETLRSEEEKGEIGDANNTGNSGYYVIMRRTVLAQWTLRLPQASRLCLKSVLRQIMFPTLHLPALKKKLTQFQGQRDPRSQPEGQKP